MPNFFPPPHFSPPMMPPPGAMLIGSNVQRPPYPTEYPAKHYPSEVTQHYQTEYPSDVTQHYPADVPPSPTDSLGLISTDDSQGDDNWPLLAQIAAAYKPLLGDFEPSLEEEEENSTASPARHLIALGANNHPQSSSAERDNRRELVDVAQQYADFYDKANYYTPTPEAPSVLDEDVERPIPPPPPQQKSKGRFGGRPNFFYLGGRSHDHQSSSKRPSTDQVDAFVNQVSEIIDSQGRKEEALLVNIDPTPAMSSTVPPRRTPVPNVGSALSSDKKVAAAHNTTRLPVMWPATRRPTLYSTTSSSIATTTTTTITTTSSKPVSLPALSTAQYNISASRPENTSTTSTTTPPTTPTTTTPSTTTTTPSLVAKPPPPPTTAFERRPPPTATNRRRLTTKGSVRNRPAPHKPRPRFRPPAPTPPSYDDKRQAAPTEIRLETCSLGDSSTCADALGEVCRRIDSVATCACAAGQGRRRAQDACRTTLRYYLYVRLGRLGKQALRYDARHFGNRRAPAYRRVERETIKGVSSLFSNSSELSEHFVSAHLVAFSDYAGSLLANVTIEFFNTSQALATGQHGIKVPHQVAFEQLQLNQRRIGISLLTVPSLAGTGALPGIQDANECRHADLNDCDRAHAVCTNTIGSYLCTCREGFADAANAAPLSSVRPGRECRSCDDSYCNYHGTCRYTRREQKEECRCEGWWIGAQCQTDGEVIAAALGASAIAVFVIVAVLVFLMRWSRDSFASSDYGDSASVMGLGGGNGHHHMGVTAQHAMGANRSDLSGNTFNYVKATPDMEQLRAQWNQHLINGGGGGFGHATRQTVYEQMPPSVAAARSAATATMLVDTASTTVAAPSPYDMRPPFGTVAESALGSSSSAQQQPGPASRACMAAIMVARSQQIHAQREEPGGGRERPCNFQLRSPVEPPVSKRR